MRRVPKSALAFAIGFTLVLVVAGCGRQTAVKTVFTVEGMHCDGCSSAITDALTGTEGVEKATADHEDGVAEAVYRPSAVAVEELEAEIEKLGYTVTGVVTEAVES